MFQNPEQFANATKTLFEFQLETFSTLTNRAMQGVEQAVALNIATARKALDDQIDAGRKVNASATPQEAMNVINARPQPREMPSPPISQPVHVIVLAAGRSSRMGGPNKLMAHFSGQPLIRQTVERTLASTASGVIVVTGHQAARIREALDGLDIKVAHNPDFASGLSSSLKAGMAAIPTDSAGALIVLGDMPVVSTADLDRLIGAFQQS